jgi:mevalonate kinase
MYELSVGSKVFLLGEYQVLGGGSAFLSVLAPRFRLLVKPGTGKLIGVNAGSPAAVYFAEQQEFFKLWDLEFVDPHQGRGGFGASTAQIGLLQGFREGLETIQAQAQLDFDLRQIHKKYLELATRPGGTPPSGADLISQFQGGLIEVDISSGRLQQHSWPFPQWQVLFFTTGRKLATHEHLSQLKAPSLESLRAIYGSAMEAFKEGTADSFLASFRAYQHALEAQGWQAEETGRWLKAINTFNGVMAAKGCGAMGADVVAVIVEKSKAVDLIKQIETLDLRYAGNLEDCTEGFHWKMLSTESAQSSLGDMP